MWNYDEIAELAEMAEESTLAEIDALGSCQGWFFGSADVSMVFETGYELWEDDRYDELWDWKAYMAASEDVPGFYAMNLSL